MLFLTIALQIILIDIPISTKQPTLLGHLTTFLTVSPSVQKVKWYSACLLKHHFWCRSQHKSLLTTLNNFRCLFKDYRPPIIFYQCFLKLTRRLHLKITEWIIQTFKELLIVSDCFIKIRTFFRKIKSFFYFFFGSSYINISLFPKVL